jgi:sigma-B regulation protein RsbU (phosphoserine phosphatase)
MDFEVIDDLLEDAKSTSLDKEQITSTATPFRVIKKLAVPNPPSEGTVSVLVSSLFYVYNTASILDLVDDLTEDQSIEAVGVVKEKGEIEGLIVREHLLQMVGKPFGRDLLGRQKLESIVMPAVPIDYTESVFTVADQLEQKGRSIQYHVLKDHEGKFRGIFSSWDLMVFLSGITKNDLSLARKIQNSLIYDMYHQQEQGFSFAFSSQMAKGIGGDFIGVKKLREDRFFISLCDVSGKGIAAALISSTIAGMLESFNFEEGVKSFLILLNSFLLKTFGSERFVTGIFFEYDASSSTVTVYDMGHSHLAFVRNKKLSPLTPPVTNPPLGVVEKLKPNRFQFSLQPADILLSYSDGLIEQESPQGTSYSLSKLKPILCAPEPLALDAAIVRIWEDFHSFRRHVPQADDVTLLLLTRSPT